MPKSRRSLVAALALLLGLHGVPNSAVVNAAAPSNQGAKGQAEPAEEARYDLLVFRDGNVVEGKLLEELPTSIRFLVVSRGGLSAETTYDRARILEIQRGKGSEIAPKAGSATAKTDVKPKPGAAPSSDKPSVYLVELTGELGRDVAAAPLREVMRDVQKSKPDVLVFKVDMDFSMFGIEREDFRPDPGNAFNQLETVRELQTMLTDEIRDNPEWTKKPRLVMWVRKALGGPAFLPFVAPEIYYTPDGRHGGIGFLERTFEGTGDKVVQEKQYSLRLGRAEGLAIKGGHDPIILRAMARADMVLSVSFEGGRPVFSENTDGEILLTDDGKDENKDTIQDIARFRANDALLLDADLAYRIGLSDGTAGTLEDLMAQLGLDRGYHLVEGRAKGVLERWGTSVTEAEVEFRRLWREYGRIGNDGENTYEDRRRRRGRQIRILTDIQNLLARYGNALNPRELEGFPDQWESQINLMIEQIKTEQRLDRR